MPNENSPPHIMLNPEMNPKQAMIALAEMLEKNYDYDYQVSQFQGNLTLYNTGIADGRCHNPMWRAIRRLISDSHISSTRFELPNQVANMVNEWTEDFESPMSWGKAQEHAQSEPEQKLTVARAIRYLAEIRTEPPQFTDDAWEIVQLMLHNPLDMPVDYQELSRRTSWELEEALARAEYGDLIPPRPWTDRKPTKEKRL